VQEKEKERKVRDEVLQNMQQAAQDQKAMFESLTLEQMKMRREERRHMNALTESMQAADAELRQRRELEAEYSQQLVLDGRWREDTFRAELDRNRREICRLRRDLDTRLETTQKVKRAWVGPLLEGLATGGLGLGK
jgi:hypothetical protein